MGEYMVELIVWSVLLIDAQNKWDMAQAGNMVPSTAVAQINWSMAPEIPVKEDHSYRIVILTAPAWCSPCRGLDNNMTTVINPVLKQSGWKIGSDKNNHIQVVDIDKDGYASNLYSPPTVPCILLVDDRVKEGYVVDQLSGAVTVKSLTDLYNRTGASKRASKK